MKKLFHVFQQLNLLNHRRTGRIYIDGGLQDRKHAPYYRLLRLEPCVTKHKDLHSLTPHWTKKRVKSEHLISRLLSFGGMANHRCRHINYVRIQGTIVVAALQLTAFCALERNLPEFIASPTRVFS